MLKSHFIIAFRNLWKNKGFSMINIAGLALGMACSLLIFLWVQDERGVDAFHQHKDRLYTIYTKMFHEGTVDAAYSTPGLLAEELKKVMPEVEKASGFGWSATAAFTSGDKILKEEGSAASADFFEMFSYSLLEGNAKEALSSPESIAISRKMAVAFFGSPAAAVNQTIRYNNRIDYTIKAVSEDLPANSSKKFSFLVNWEAFKKDNNWLTDWGNNAPQAFLLLRADADPALVQKKLTNFLQAYNKSNPAYHSELWLQRYDAQYLHSHFSNGQLSGGRIEYVRLFSVVALFILLIACINFMNLTTARSVKRLKEIGVRKVMGAVRGQLIWQFIGEAVLVAIVSAVLAIAIVLLVLPFFNQLTGKQIVLPFARPGFWMMLAGLTLLTGIFSGSYPSLFLSAFSPIRVLKGSLHPGTGTLWFRKGLVVFQFVLSIILIISTILISRQVKYVQDANLGYDRANLVYIPIEGNLATQQEVFKQMALNTPGVDGVTKMLGNPTNINTRTSDVDWEGRDPSSKSYVNHTAIGYGYISTMHLHMLQGRDFSKAFPTDSAGYILNETAVKKMGYKDPIGKSITFWGKKGHIIGVVRDFHFQSLHNNIDPLVLRLDRSRGTDVFGTFSSSTFLVRTQPGKTAQVLAGLEKICKELNPTFPFTYKFSDEEYTRLYNSEQVIGRLSVIFAILAIFISCLGLLGLSIFTAEQRRKELSIRKILGASAGSLFGLLSSDFLTLVGLAFLIAVPLAWWGMHQWLQQFAYQTQLSWWIFGLSGLIAVLIALGTISLQAIKAININLIKSLRAE